MKYNCKSKSKVNHKTRSDAFRFLFKTWLIPVLTLVSTGLSSTLLAQPSNTEMEQPEIKGFRKMAKLDKVNYTGFHKIVLSPEILGQLRRNKTDIRIYDQSNKQIPYLMDHENPFETTRLFKEYEIIEKHYVEDGVSYLIFHNPNRDEVDNINFLVRNTDVRKRARLSGSDDKENWFVIKNDYLLHSMYSRNETSELNILGFPLSNYEYFRLELNDYWRLPIDIQKVGFFDYKQRRGQRHEFEAANVEQKDSNKVTYLKVEFPQERYIEKLQFDIEGADYYLRSGVVQIEDSYFDKKKKVKTYRQNIKSFEFNSNSINEFELNLQGRRVKTLYFEVQNNDDQPLQIKKVTGSFLKHYLIADLNPQGQYTLKFSDNEAEVPKYDLTYFRTNIPEDIATVKHGPIKNLIPANSLPVVKEEEKSFLSDPYVLWSVLGGIGIILAVVSFRMVKEIGNKED